MTRASGTEDRGSRAAEAWTSQPRRWGEEGREAEGATMAAEVEMDRREERVEAHRSKRWAIEKMRLRDMAWPRTRSWV